MVSEIMR